MYKSPKKLIKKVVRVEQRNNRGQNNFRNDLKKKGYYMIDSSYSQAANPNSMRSFGPAKNVVYNFQPQDAGATDDSSRYGESDAKSVSERSAFDFNCVVRNHDYTKNISQSIFTPGVHQPTKRAEPKKQGAPSIESLVNYKVDRRQNYTRGGTPHLKALQIDDKVTTLENQRKRRERLLQLKNEIKAERSLKAELKEQLKDIKRDMTTRLALVDLDRKSSMTK